MLTGLDEASRNAATEGMVVIDDPASILRCTNKVYLADLFRTRKVPAPRTHLLHGDGPGQVERLEEDGEQLERRLDETVETGLDEVRGELSGVEQRAAAGDRRLDEMAARLDELAGEVERLRDLALPSLSYVVKAGAQTRIPELGLSLEVGKLENGSLAGVRVFETAGGRQLYPSDGAAPVALGLGVPFVVDDAGRRFRLTFGYSVNRWVARDLVGLEVRRLPR